MKLSKRVMDDIDKLNQFALNQQFKDIQIKDLQYNLQQFKKNKHNFNNTQSTGSSTMRGANGINGADQDQLSPEEMMMNAMLAGGTGANGTTIGCKYCNGFINTQGGYFIHEDSCVYDAAEYCSEIEENDELDESESEIDRYVDQFKAKLELIITDKRMKPNVSHNWIRSLRETLEKMKSGSNVSGACNSDALSSAEAKKSSAPSSQQKAK